MIPFALRCLQNLSQLRNYDISGMGPGFSNDTTNDTPPPPLPLISQQQNIPSYVGTNGGTVRNIVDLNHEYFRQQLVENFDILFQKNKIVWPRSVKTKPMVI